MTGSPVSHHVTWKLGELLHEERTALSGEAEHRPAVVSPTARTFERV